MMKRPLALFLALALCLLSACAEAPEKENGSQGEDLSSLTATELYARAAEKMDLLSSYALLTTVSNGETEYRLETRRARAGYDRFSYSRVKNQGEEGIYFDGESAYFISAAGAFCAPATTVAFKQFLATQSFPTAALEMEHFVQIERDDMTISYREADDAVKEQFAALGDFTVTEVWGTATISQALLIESEEIHVAGTLADGSDCLYTLKSSLTSHDEKDFAVAAPPEEGVMRINDIRLPDLLTSAGKSLSDAALVSVILVDESEIQSAESHFYHYSTDYLNRVAENWSVRESFAQGATGSEEIRREVVSLYQGGTLIKAVFDGVTGETLSQETTPGSGVVPTLSSGETLVNLLPTFTGLASANMTEEAEGYSVSFTWNEMGIGALAAAAQRYFSMEDALAADGMQADGAMAIRKSDGALTSLSFRLTAKNAAGATVTRRVSLSADFENAALEPVEPPTPVT